MLASRRAFLLLFLCAGYLACRAKGDPVQETLDRVVRAAEKRDASAVVENLSAGYRDAEG